jgi:starch synthase
MDARNSPSKAANAAIYFEAEGYSTSGPKLMGRHAAGEGFLRGFVRHAEVDTLYCFAANRAAAQTFARLCEQYAQHKKKISWVPFDGLSRLSEAGTLYLPGPNLTEMAWRRRRVGSNRFSLCAITHTIASHRAMDALADALTAPVEPWDAVICTSRSVLDSVQKLLDSKAQYLKERLEAQSVPRPTLALIPLGTDCDALTPDLSVRHGWRERLGIAAEDVAFLFMGRLSFHAKANPLPMYVALEQAATRTSKRLHLIQAGWFPNESIESDFRVGAKQLCPSVNAIFLDGREPAVRREVWQAADVFTSLADNIQETFGLTPVEAMAAGLPSVVSDWDGYRDTVRDGVDGFLIRTLMPPAPAGADLAARYDDGVDSYDRYIGYASQFISVDMAACVEVYARLANDAALRRQMGASAREKALAEFDWSVIIRRYQELWQALSTRRRAEAASPSASAGLPNPRRSDPFWLFASYPTAILAPTERLTLSPGASRDQLGRLRSSPFTKFAQPVLPSDELCTTIIDRLAREPGCTVASLLESVSPAERHVLMRAMVWLHKLGLVRLG